MEWISVKDRLPNADKEVLVWYRGQSFNRDYFSYEIGELDDQGQFWIEGDVRAMEVLAWMPLPEPYKESK